MVKKACFKNKLHSLFGDMLDIPPWWDFRSYYNATLAHMVNNRFEPNINCKFGAMEHPRFGWVSSKPFLIYYSVHFNFQLESLLLFYVKLELKLKRDGMKMVFLYNRHYQRVLKLFEIFLI